MSRRWDDEDARLSLSGAAGEVVVASDAFHSICPSGRKVGHGFSPTRIHESTMAVKCEVKNDMIVLH